MFFAPPKERATKSGNSSGAKSSRVEKQSTIDLCHSMECKACPLQGSPGGNMRATGSKEPLIYCLGDIPEAAEISEQRPFAGESGKLLRARIPKRFKSLMRWNNVVRSHPKNGKVTRLPERVEIESCRPSVIRDIEQTKPKAIFGFGNIPLDWACDSSGITAWRGRRLPVKIGDHVCWYYPMLHPVSVLKQRRGRHMNPTAIGSEEERAFVFDLKRAFKEVEDLPDAVVHDEETALKDVVLLDEFGSAGIRAIRDALEWASSQVTIGIDYETTCLRPYEAIAKVLTCGFGTGKLAYSFGIDHPGCKWSSSERSKVIDLWKEFIRETKAIKIAHNLAFELEWTGVHFGQDLVRAGKWEDTQIQANIIDDRTRGAKPGPMSLNFLCRQYFGFDMKALAGLDTRKLSEVPLPNVLEYNAVDARYAELLWKKQHAQLKKLRQHDIYKQTLRRLPTVILTQMKGVPVNQKTVSILSKKYSSKAIDLNEKILGDADVLKFKRKTKRDFNPTSPDNVIHLFSDVLGFEEECRVFDKKKGDYRFSSNEEVLAKIDHPVARQIVDLRKTNKMLATYIEPLKPGIESSLHPDGLLHAQFNITFTSTGRLSCEDPNLQNFPKRGGEIVEVRKPIVAAPGCIAISVDMGQIEARTIAMFTKDERFCKALWDRYDIHMEWAERIAHAYPKRIGGKQNLKDKKVMKTFRSDVKNQWTFPLVFGCSVTSASEYLHIPENVIQRLYDDFWEEFSGIHDWQQELLKSYKEKGYVENLLGRRRYAPLSVNKVYNTPIQSTAAELILDSMCRLSETGDPALQAEMQIHDDLTFLRIPEKKADDYLEKIVEAIIISPFDFVNVPLTAEASIGFNWYEMEECGTFESDRWKNTLRSKAA